MANIHDCLGRAVEAGELDKDRAAAAAEEFDALAARYRNVMPEHQAEAAALADLKEATRRAARSRRHMVLNQLQMMRRLKALIEGAKDPTTALVEMFESAPGSGFDGENFRFVHEALVARVRADMRDTLRAVGQNVTGRSRDVATLQELIRELHGQDTGNVAAQGYARAVRRVQAWQRDMFNALGGDIGHLEDYGVRHAHDGVSIRRAGFDAWADHVTPRLAWHRITDLNTGKPFANEGQAPDPDAARAFLDRVYKQITTDGWWTRDPGLTGGGKALYRSRDDARVLHFASGDAWMEYNAKFGTADPFTALVGGMDAMARDIALMRIFGPNPNSGLEFAIQTATKRVKTTGSEKARAKLDRMVARSRTLMHHATGAVNRPEHEAWARAMSNLRHLNVASKLGSAVLSSVTDLATTATLTAVMRRAPTNILSRAVDLTASAATRDSAARMGFVADTLMSIGTSSARLTNDVVASDVASRLSGFTIRASGLAAWTDMFRVAVQMETAGHLADNAARSWDEIDHLLRDALRRNGVTAQDWDHLRQLDGRFTADSGADFIAPYHWLEHQTVLPRAEAEALASRVQAAIQDQVELFMPSKRMRATSWWIGQTRPGTPVGELARSTIGFKNYALSLTMGQIHLWRALPTPQTKAIYLAMGAATMVSMGALAIQLKELDKGRDPRPMDEAAFWLAAVLQSGGLGIFGDFLFSEQNRFGGGFAQTLAGPVVGLIGDAIRIPMSNIKLAVDGKDTKLGADLVNFARYNTPVASSLWQTRLAFDRLVADQVQALLDPDAEANWRRRAANQRRSYGNTSWWAQGELAPQRIPDVTTVSGAAR